MKKIIITLSVIVISITTAILLVVLWPNNMEELKVTNYNGIVLNFGTYKAKNFIREEIANQRDTISFDVENENEFYNNVIKINEHYNSDLDFEIDKYYAYGYYCFDDCIFNYTIRNKKVCITACFVIYQDVLDYDKMIYKNYVLPGPFLGSYIHKDSFEDGIDCLKMDSLIGYKDMAKLISYLPQKIWIYQNDTVLMKGIRNETSGDVIYSDYVLELFEKNEFTYVRLHNEIS